MCHMSYFFFFSPSDKVAELVGGGSVINGATSPSLGVLLSSTDFIKKFSFALEGSEYWDIFVR